jgi:hypothetical protein
MVLVQSEKSAAGGLRTRSGSNNLNGSRRSAPDCESYENLKIRLKLTLLRLYGFQVLNYPYSALMLIRSKPTIGIVKGLEAPFLDLSSGLGICPTMSFTSPCKKSYGR